MPVTRPPQSDGPSLPPADPTPPIGVIEDPRYREHQAPEGHPERPARLLAVGSALAEQRGRWQPRAARSADDDEIRLVHDAAHLARVEAAARSAPGQLDPDTYVSSRSFDVARLAAGAAVDLSCAVARGELHGGIAAIRPPGHHAEPDRAMGFCLFNNVAIAARALRVREGVERILVLDWDVHHGNGTQHSFEDDPSVLYVSTHQFPYYPGTGAAEEIGVGRGAGATFNVPMPAGCGDDEYVGVFQRLVVPATRRFRPELILVSCGFDAHRDDPLAHMNVSRAGFAALTTIVRALAEDHCDGRVVFLLEGGYADSGLREGTQAVLQSMLAPALPALPPDQPLLPGSMLRAVVERVVAVHGSRIPGLGAV